MSKKHKVVAVGAAVLALLVGVAASVNLHGNTINADTGYQVGAAAPFGHTLVGNGTVYVDSGSGTAATCSTAGCYRINTDGTVQEWGTISDSAFSCSGNARCTVPITFPYALTSTTNLIVQCTVSGLSESANESNFICGIDGAPSTTGITIDPAALIYVGGTGSNLTGNEILNWSITQ